MSMDAEKSEHRVVGREWVVDEWVVGGSVGWVVGGVVGSSGGGGWFFSNQATC